MMATRHVFLLALLCGSCVAPDESLLGEGGLRAASRFLIDDAESFRWERRDVIRGDESDIEVRCGSNFRAGSTTGYGRADEVTVRIWGTRRCPAEQCLHGVPCGVLRGLRVFRLEGDLTTEWGVLIGERILVSATSEALLERCLVQSVDLGALLDALGTRLEDIAMGTTIVHRRSSGEMRHEWNPFSAASPPGLGLRSHMVQYQHNRLRVVIYAQKAREASDYYQAKFRSLWPAASWSVVLKDGTAVLEATIANEDGSVDLVLRQLYGYQITI